MATQTFELVSPFLTIYAPSKKWDSTKSDLLLGQTATRLVTGEMLELSGSNGVTRGLSSTFTVNLTFAAATGEIGTGKFCAPYFSETGRGDIVTGGNVPILQFGPFEADTMLFMRVGDDAVNLGIGGGSMAGGAHTGFAVGEKVYAWPVRNPNTDKFQYDDFVWGVAPASGIADETTAFCVGRVSRISGSGASAKIRVMFGVN
jgi:hypothetical protein